MVSCGPSVKCHPVSAGFFCPETLTGERRAGLQLTITATPASSGTQLSSYRASLSPENPPKCLKGTLSGQNIERSRKYGIIVFNGMRMYAFGVAPVADKSKIWPQSWALVTMGQSCICDLQRWVWPSSSPLQSWLFAISEQSQPAVAGHAAVALGLEMSSWLLQFIRVPANASLYVA